jgi:hypothetical protein
MVSIDELQIERIFTLISPSSYAPAVQVSYSYFYLEGMKVIRAVTLHNMKLLIYTHHLVLLWQ